MIHVKCPKCEQEMARESVSPIEIISIYFGVDIYNPIIKHHCTTRDEQGNLCGVAFLEFERA